MVKSYRAKLNTKKVEIAEGLHKIARVYRKFYNLGISRQSELRRFMLSVTPEQVTDYLLKVYCMTPSAHGVNTGVIKAAALASYKSYSDSIKKTGQQPKFMPRNTRTYCFKTEEIHVFEDSIEIPNFGKVPVYRKNFLPQEKESKDIIFSYDGCDWWVSFKVSEEAKERLNLSGVSTLSFDDNGGVLIDGEKVDENVFLSKKYRNVYQRYNFFLSTYKRKARANKKLMNSGKTSSLISKNMLDVREKLRILQERIKQMKTCSVARVANVIKGKRPLEVHVLSNTALRNLCKHSSFKLGEKDASELLRSVSRRLTDFGATVISYDI